MQEQLALSIDSVDPMAQEIVEDVPDLVQVILYHPQLMAAYEVNLFNALDVLPLFEVGKWHAIMMPGDESNKIITRCDDAKTFEDVMLHCSLLHPRLGMKGVVAVNPIYVVSKYDDGIIAVGRDSTGTKLNMVIEFVEGVLKFNVIQ